MPEDRTIAGQDPLPHKPKLGGKALFQMMGVFAGFERAIIRERVNAGLERAGTEGKKPGCPRMSAGVEPAILEARAQGKGMPKMARELGGGTGAVQRVAAANRRAPSAEAWSRLAKHLLTGRIKVSLPLSSSLMSAFRRKMIVR